MVFGRVRYAIAVAILFVATHARAENEGFWFGSYGRVGISSDLDGSKGKPHTVVSHGTRIEEPLYAELDFYYAKKFGEMSVVVHTTLGFLRDIQAMPSGFDYSREFFRRYYTPDDATVVVCGDFDAKDALERIQKAYGGWRGRADPAPIPKEPRQAKSRRATVAWKSPTIPRLAIYWHGYGAQSLKDAATQIVLAPYLFGKTSPLYQQLVLTKQLVKQGAIVLTQQESASLSSLGASSKGNQRVSATSCAVAGGRSPSRPREYRRR